MGKIKKVKPVKAPPCVQKATSQNDDDDIPKLVKAPAVSSKVRINKSVQKEDPEKLVFEKTSTVRKTISKKDKRKQKQKSFQSKINIMKEQLKHTPKKNKNTFLKKPSNQKTAITSDLRTLKDALPSLDELFKYKSATMKTGIAEYDIPKSKNQLKKESKRTKKQAMIDRMKRFTNLLKDPDYKKNARETIANHIKFSRDLSDS